MFSLLFTNGLTDLDLSVQRCTNRLRLQFRFDAYNALNHVSLNLPGKIFGLRTSVLSAAGALPKRSLFGKRSAGIYVPACSWRYLRTLNFAVWFVFGAEAARKVRIGQFESKQEPGSIADRARASVDGIG